jgi:uncharacterized protein (DUF2236 family)
MIGDGSTWRKPGYTVQMASAIRLPFSVQRRIDAAAQAFLDSSSTRPVDFSSPPQEQALVSPDSISWRIFKNPASLFVGGVAAVILELAQAQVRTGVWEHSSFRQDPAGRLRRTGLAAMITVYGARSIAEPMIASVARRHAAIVGETPAGVRYAASDSALLRWVHATAAFSFANAYGTYVAALSETELNAFYSEGTAASRLYGVLDAPKSTPQLRAIFESMQAQLEPSPIVFEFLRMMVDTPAFPKPLSWLQPVMVRAAVDIVPEWIRLRLGLTQPFGLGNFERWIVRYACSVSDRIVLPAGPAVQSCHRLGLPTDYLYH